MDDLVKDIRSHHNRKRLLKPSQPPFEFTGRTFRAYEMEPSDPTYRENESLVKERGRFHHRVRGPDLVAGWVKQCKHRAAYPAGNRLGMVPPGQGIGILLSTRRTLREGHHRSPFPVIGE